MRVPTQITSRALSTTSRTSLIGLMTFVGWTLPCQAQIQVPGDYATIQAAVDAATSGMTINVAAGQYEEQVRIEGKNLTLRGDPGATLLSPPALAEVSLGGPLAAPRRPLLSATDCEVNLRGLAFDGLRRGGEIPRFTGVLYVSAAGTVRDCDFTGFRPQSAGPLPFNPLPERAIQMNNTSDVVMVAVRSCSFSDNVDSIFVSGPLGTDPNALSLKCDIANNVIVGLGPQPFNTQIGIQLSAGARGLIRGNHVSGHEYLASDNFSLAIVTGGLGLPPDFVMQRVLVFGNTTVNNSVGILSLFGHRSLMFNNSVTGGMFGFSGIATSGDRNQVVHNSIHMGQSVVPGNSGVLLLGAEFDAGFGTGFATDTRVIANTINGAFFPIWSQTGVTGTIESANNINP